MDDQTPRKSLARRLLRLAVILSLLAIAVIGALPWLLSLPPGRDAVLAAVNRSIAPSRLSATGLSLSWAGSIRVSGLSLRDKAGKTLLSARLAVLDRGLLALASDHSRLGTLTVDGASIDVERRADGSIDLVDALSPPRPSATPPPAEPAAPATAPSAIDVTLRVVRSTIKVTTPELAEPFTADQVDVEVRVPAAADQKLSWKVRLAQPKGGTASEALGLDGEFDHHAAAVPDLSLTLKGSRWPLALATAGTIARAKLDGALTARRDHGQWSSSGEAKLLGLDAAGPALAGDKLAFDEVGAAWNLAQKDGAWSISTLSVATPVGSLSAAGGLSNTAAGETITRDSRIEGRVDLAALARQIPHTLRLKDGLTLERGSARLLIQVTPRGDSQQATVEMSLSDLVARESQPARTFTLKDPANVTAKATRGPSGFNVETLQVKTPFLNLTGSGDLQKGVNLAGTVDLARIEVQFRDLIDFGALKLAGQGRMAARYSKKGASGFLGQSVVEIRGLNIVGLTTEPIVRDLIHFDAAGTGPADPSGLPAAWDNVRINLKSAKDSVTIAATNRNSVSSLNVAASLPVTVSQRAGQGDLKLVGRWRTGKDQVAGLSLSGVVELDELRLGLRPLDPKLASAGTLGFAARGWIDLDDDGLQFTPLPCPAPLVLGPEGLKLHGLRKTPLASMAGKGVFIGDVAAIEQALFVWTGREPSGLDGALAAQFGMGPGAASTLNLGLNLSVPDLSRAAPDGKGRKPEGPLTFAYLGSYDPAADRLKIGNIVALTRYARLDVTGTLDNPNGRRLADLQGVLAPNWVAVSAMAAEMTEPGARLQGKDHAFRLKGALAGDSLAAILKGLDAEVGIDLTSADIMGLNLGPAPVVVRCKGGTFTVDPIKTTLNNGVVDLKPGLAVDEVQGIALLLAPGSKIEGAEVNDEVSKDLLSFIAPVLDKATNVHGKISANIDKADIPLTGPPTHRLTMTGKLDFQDVVFAPGPFANQMLGLVGKKNEPGVKLKQPVELSIADGRVYQKGLNVPIAANAAILLAGSVGFDETLDMKASVPITKGMLGGVSGLDDLVADNKITVPIGGTISHPQINRQALQVALRELTKNVFKRDLSSQAEKLLDRLGPAPDASTKGSKGGNSGLPSNLKGLENQLLRRLQPPASNPPNP